jgi:hypothetical protein
MNRLKDASSVIQEEMNTIIQRIEDIHMAQKTITNISEENSLGMAEITQGVQEVSKAMDMVNDLNVKLDSSFNMIVDGIQIFKTEDESLNP